MQGEFARRMTKLLGTLPDRQREILLLRFVVGLSAEETAGALGSTPGAVRVAQHRALNRLRSVLASEAMAEEFGLFDHRHGRPRDHTAVHEITL